MARLLWALPMLLLTCLLMAACSETDDTVEEYPDWQNYNQTQWKSIYGRARQQIAAGDTSWKIIKSWSLQDSVKGNETDYVVVHVKASGAGKGSPLYTDSVWVNYRGHLLPSATHAEGYQFDSSWGSSTSAETAIPAGFKVSKVKNGFATALQQMHVGDRWEVYVPWTLAYGDTKAGTIPAYSVLVFDMELVNYFGISEAVPDVKARPYLWRETE